MQRRVAPIRTGFTIVELLIATTITLLIMLTMLRAFVVANREIRIGRNRVISAERVQRAADVIRQDLERLSIPLHSIPNGTKHQGYFLYVDGPFRDQTFTTTVGASSITNYYDNSVMGDVDDVLMFTAVSKGKPFRGRFAGSLIESQAAEIIYWTELVRDYNANGFPDYGDQIKVYRRVLLIRPDLNARELSVAMTARSGGIDSLGLATPAAGMLTDFYLVNDVSISSRSVIEAGTIQVSGGIRSYNLRANSLASLSKLENRTCHFSWRLGRSAPSGSPFVFTDFPYVPYRCQPNLQESRWRTATNRSLTFPTPDTVNAANPTVPATLSDLKFTLDINGNVIPNQGHVVLDNAIAFDVKVFDPDVPVFSSKLTVAGGERSDRSLRPHDPGYIDWIGAPGTAEARLSLAGFGGYVDLGCFNFQEPYGHSPGGRTVNQLHVPGNFDGSLSGVSTSINEDLDFSSAATNQVYSTANMEFRHPSFCYWDAAFEKHLLTSPSGDRDLYAALVKNRFMYRGIGNPQIMGPTYTTFSSEYERNFFDEDGDGRVDEGRDGLQKTDTANSTHGNSFINRDAIPPYDYPIRSIQVIVRTGSFGEDNSVVSGSDQVVQRSVEIQTNNK